MDSVYLISLIVGGFFVLLSIFGGGDQEGDADADADADVDTDHDFDHDADVDHDFDHDVDVGHDLGVHADVGPGFVDLLSIRALFLFAAFFGLTGTALGLLGSQEPWTVVFSVLTGLVVGLGGNWLIKRFAYEQVSSAVSALDLTGRTARVILPFVGPERGRILVEARGQRMQITARSLDAEGDDPFSPGDEVVVVRMDGRVAEVVKPE
jgi:membrane protein implicated in regulation of membrane protease activity